MTDRHLAAAALVAARRAGRSAARWLSANGPELYRGRHVLNAADAARRAWHFALIADRAAGGTR